jgi:hypothetical protein
MGGDHNEGSKPRQDEFDKIVLSQKRIQPVENAQEAPPVCIVMNFAVAGVSCFVLRIWDRMAVLKLPTRELRL